MLRKEVDYVPLSPKKIPVLRSGVSGLSRHASMKSISRSALEEDHLLPPHAATPGGRIHERKIDEIERPNIQQDKVRTTEEKKELLSNMLGNVDALVEGVRKAGIWGLG